MRPRGSIQGIASSSSITFIAIDLRDQAAPLRFRVGIIQTEAVPFPSSDFGTEVRNASGAIAHGHWAKPVLVSALGHNRYPFSNNVVLR